MSGKIKAVVFDVGEVLFHWDMGALFRQVIDEPDRLAFFMREVLTFEFHSRHDAGEEIEALAEELRARHPEFAPAVEAYVHRFNETITGPVAGVHELARRLAARGVPLFGLTNFGAHFWHRFRPTAPIFDLFTDIVVSGDEKLAKPDPAIYQLAETRFGRAPGELFFADDRAENVVAAAARGWCGHLFTDAISLEGELQAHGLI